MLYQKIEVMNWQKNSTQNYIPARQATAMQNQSKEVLL